MRWISKFRTLFSGRPVGALFAITKRQVFLRGDRKSGSSAYLRTGVVGQDEVLKQLLSALSLDNDLRCLQASSRITGIGFGSHDATANAALGLFFHDHAIQHGHSRVSPGGRMCDSTIPPTLPPIFRRRRFSTELRAADRQSGRCAGVRSAHYPRPASPLPRSRIP